jgi:hypothetical protein
MHGWHFKCSNRHGFKKSDSRISVENGLIHKSIDGTVGCDMVVGVGAVTVQ